MSAIGLVLLVVGVAACGSTQEPPLPPQPEVLLWWQEGAPLVVLPVRESPGPEHCNWGRAQFIEYPVRGELFLRDPEGVTRSWAGDLDGLELDAVLPADAGDTGYRDGERQLWAAPDLAFVYVVEEEQVERWPRVPAEWRKCY